MLQRSVELEVRIQHVLDSGPDEPFDASLLRAVAAFGACLVALEHSRSLRLLIGQGLPNSGVSLMRLQHEALTRAVWLMYAASDEAVDKITAPLSSESLKAASRLPMLADMLKEMIGQAPLPAVQMLTHFKEVTTAELNSLVHGSIHSVHRQLTGFPVSTLATAIKSSNGLLTMTGMILALLTGDKATMLRMRKIQRPFADCLPDLLTSPLEGGTVASSV